MKQVTTVYIPPLGQGMGNTAQPSPAKYRFGRGQRIDVTVLHRTLGHVLAPGVVDSNNYLNCRID